MRRTARSAPPSAPSKKLSFVMMIVVMVVVVMAVVLPFFRSLLCWRTFHWRRLRSC